MPKRGVRVAAVITAAFVVGLVLPLPLRVAALAGDAQLLAALSWTLTSLPIERGFLLTDQSMYDQMNFYHDCPRNASYFALPERDQATGVFKHVLDSGVLRIASTDQDVLNLQLWKTGLDFLAQHYGCNLTANITQYATQDLAATALNNNEADCTNINFGTSGMVLGERKSLMWNTVCTVMAYPIHLSSRKETHITTVDELRSEIASRKILGQPSKIAVTNSALASAMLQLFGAHGMLYSGVDIVRLMKQPNDFLAASATVLWEDNSLEQYNAQGVMPSTIFVRRESNPNTKKLTPEDWEQGNSDLARAYEAALMEISQSGFRDQLFSAWNITPCISVDCVATHSGFPTTEKGDLKNGTLYNLVFGKDSTFKVAYVYSDNPLLDTVSYVEPRGVLHSLNFAVMEWISNEYNINPPLTLNYTLYQTMEEAFAAVATGKAHATANFIATEALYNGSTTAASVLQPSTCSVIALPLHVYVPQNLSGVSSLKELFYVVESDPTAKVGGVGTANTEEMYMFFANSFRDVDVIRFSTTTDAFTSILAGVTIAVLADYTPGVEDKLPVGIRFFASGQFRPYTTFFRQDKVGKCQDNEVDAALGEECLPGGENKCTDTCECIAGFHAQNPPTAECVKDDEEGSWKIIVGSVVGGVAFLVFLVVLAVVAVVAFTLRVALMKPKKEYQFVMMNVVDGTPETEKFNAAYSAETRLNDFPLECSVATLSFGLGSHQPDVGAHLTETFSFTNNHKRATLFFRFYPVHCGKFNIEFDPKSGEVKPSAKKEITAHFVALCTCKIDFSLLAAVSRSEQLHTVTEAADVPYAELEDLRHTLLPLCLETKLSTKLDPDELELQQPPIGEGSYGCVYRGTWRGQEVAIKIVKCQIEDCSMDSFLQEVNMLERLRAPQIITFIGAVHTPGKLAMVTEFMPLGNLTSAMQRTKFSVLLKVNCLLDCAKGMNFLHTSGVLHRDLKSDNLLMVSLDEESSVNCKISDFGTTREVQKAADSSNMTKALGTPIYMSPEVLEQGAYSASTDVYSFAIIAYQVYTEKEPYLGSQYQTTWSVSQFVVSGQRLPLAADTPEPFMSVISKSWAHKADTRPTFAALVTILEEAAADLKQRGM
eukprot:TRINITY_DN68_c1_g1_i9.p1 TRINITY_DN68_c1_g1~~TRINITY_DN68_c1_g1_i9.p1  ORF type:complete len:1111 (+),score=210.72 TRINITY_DN68_c1_g1_i9:82-3414(+)